MRGEQTGEVLLSRRGAQWKTQEGCSSDDVLSVLSRTLLTGRSRSHPRCSSTRCRRRFATGSFLWAPRPRMTRGGAAYWPSCSELRQQARRVYGRRVAGAIARVQNLGQSHEKKSSGSPARWDDV